MRPGHADLGVADFIKSKDGLLPPHERQEARTMFAKHHALATIREVAAYFVVSQITIRRWIKRGLLPATKVGGQIRIKWTDVEALVASGKVNPAVDGLTDQESTDLDEND